MMRRYSTCASSPGHTRPWLVSSGQAIGAPAAAAACSGGSAASHSPATKRRPVTPSDAGEASHCAGGAMAAGGIISLRANGAEAGTIRVSVGPPGISTLIVTPLFWNSFAQIAEAASSAALAGP